MNGAPGAGAAGPAGPAKKGALGSRAAKGTAFSLGGQLVSQVLRLASNLILTRLLDPDAFGLMAIVVAVTTGLTLVSDVGVWQAIVRSPRGDDRQFLDTAWTLHVGRGFVLFAVACGVAWPASIFYGRSELLWLLPLCASQALFNGLESTKSAQASRHLDVGRIVAMDLTTQVVGLCVSVPVGFLTHSAVALVVASVMSAAVRCGMTHFFLPGPLNRLRWDKTAAVEIFTFGRWVFFSTIFFFIGTRYDVFALGRLEGMGVIGIYGLAQMIVQVPSQMGERVTYSVLLPALSERFRESPARFAADLRHARAILLPAAAVLFLGAAMTAPAFFQLLYRDVYVDAGWMVQFLVVTSWCMFLQESSARALMALGDSAPLAISNFVRVAATVAFTAVGFHFGAQLPFAGEHYGPVVGFMIGNSGGALVGALVMGHGLRKHGVRIQGMDLVATAAFLAVGVVGCGVPVLLAPIVHAPAAYLTLVSVLVVLGPIGLIVASRTREALRSGSLAGAS